MDSLSSTRKITLLGLALLLTVALVVPMGTARAQSGYLGMITADVLNVRSGPGPGHTVIDTLYYGEVVVLLARDSRASWLQVGLPDGERGWVTSYYVSTSINLSNLPVASSAAAWGYINNASYVNLREGPSTSFAAIGVLPQGTYISLLGRTADLAWVEVAANGLIGWVNYNLITTDFSIGALPITGSNLTPTYPGVPSGSGDPVGTVPGTEVGGGGVPSTVTTGTPSAIVTTPRLNVRTGPGAMYPSFATISGGDVVELLGRNAGSSWAYVRIYDGSTGWVTTYYLAASVRYSTLPVMQ